MLRSGPGCAGAAGRTGVLQMLGAMRDIAASTSCSETTIDQLFVSSTAMSPPSDASNSRQAQQVQSVPVRNHDVGARYLGRDPIFASRTAYNISCSPGDLRHHQRVSCCQRQAHLACQPRSLVVREAPPHVPSQLIAYARMFPMLQQLDRSARCDERSHCAHGIAGSVLLVLAV